MTKKSTLLLLFALLLNIGKINSQCVTGAMDATINVTPVFQTTPVPGGSPSYFQFTGIAGATYFFTYCQGGGNYVGDPYLTIATNAPAALVWNDDFCGLGSNLTTWVCPANGLYRIYTSGCCPCGGKAAGSNLAFKYDLPPCSGTPPASSSTATPTSLCAGNSATMGLTTNYVNPGFTFQWQQSPTPFGPWNNITGANTSTYSMIMNSTTYFQCIVTCTPSGLSTISGNVLITVNPSPTVVINGTNSICAGQTLTLEVSGATTYTWNNGSNIAQQSYTPTSNTTYSVIGLAGGCTGTAAINVTVNPNPTVTIAGSNTACAGAPLTLTASGANSYTWSTGDLTPVMTTTPFTNVTITVYGDTPAGCSASASIPVTVSPVPSSTVTGPNAMCIGQTITLSAVAAGATSYTWSNGAPTQSIVISPTTTTQYSVSGISSLGCVGPSAVKNVVVNPKPNIIAAVCSPTICKGEVCTFTASGGDSYQWNTGALTSTIIVSPSVTTNYTVTGTNTTTGCYNTTTVQLVVALCTGVDQQNFENDQLAVYPNPNNGEFTIEFKQGLNHEITIYDITGKEVYVNKAETDKLNVNISKLPNGIYYLKMNNDQSTVIKIVKQK